MAIIMSNHYTCRRELPKAVDKGDVFEKFFWAIGREKFLRQRLQGLYRVPDLRGFRYNGVR